MCLNWLVCFMSLDSCWISNYIYVCVCVCFSSLSSSSSSTDWILFSLIAFVLTSFCSHEFIYMYTRRSWHCHLLVTFALVVHSIFSIFHSFYLFFLYTQIYNKSKSKRNKKKIVEYHILYSPNYTNVRK